MSHYDDQANAEKLDAKRAAADLANSRADVPRKYHLGDLKTARRLPCICGMCRQIIDEEIKVLEANL